MSTSLAMEKDDDEMTGLLSKAITRIFTSFPVMTVNISLIWPQKWFTWKLKMFQWEINFDWKRHAVFTETLDHRSNHRPMTNYWSQPNTRKKRFEFLRDKTHEHYLFTDDETGSGSGPDSGTYDALEMCDGIFHCLNGADESPNLCAVKRNKTCDPSQQDCRVLATDCPNFVDFDGVADPFPDLEELDNNSTTASAILQVGCSLNLRKYAERMHCTALPSAFTVNHFGWPMRC